VVGVISHHMRVVVDVCPESASTEDGAVRVMFKVDEMEGVLCTLRPGETPQAYLDLRLYEIPDTYSTHFSYPESCQRPHAPSEYSGGTCYSHRATVDVLSFFRPAESLVSFWCTGGHMVHLCGYVTPHLDLAP
jgi:hypothetical protein